MARLRDTIKQRGWTQQEAAEKLGIGQSHVSDLMRGKWDKLSLDMLITLTTRTGFPLSGTCPLSPIWLICLGCCVSCFISRRINQHLPKETLINSSHRRKPVSSSLIFLDSGLRRNDEFRINQHFLS